MGHTLSVLYSSLFALQSFKLLKNKTKKKTFFRSQGCTKSGFRLDLLTTPPIQFFKKLPNSNFTLDYKPNYSFPLFTFLQILIKHILLAGPHPQCCGTPDRQRLCTYGCRTENKYICK